MYLYISTASHVVFKLFLPPFNSCFLCFFFRFTTTDSTDPEGMDDDDDDTDDDDG